MKSICINNPGYKASVSTVSPLAGWLYLAFQHIMHGHGVDSCGSLTGRSIKILFFHIMCSLLDEMCIILLCSKILSMLVDLENDVVDDELHIIGVVLTVDNSSIVDLYDNTFSLGCTTVMYE